MPLAPDRLERWGPTQESCAACFWTGVVSQASLYSRQIITQPTGRSRACHGRSNTFVMACTVGHGHGTISCSAQCSHQRL